MSRNIYLYIQDLCSEFIVTTSFHYGFNGQQICTRIDTMMTETIPIHIHHKTMQTLSWCQTCLVHGTACLKLPLFTHTTAEEGQSKETKRLPRSTFYQNLHPPCIHVCLRLEPGCLSCSPTLPCFPFVASSWQRSPGSGWEAA